MQTVNHRKLMSNSFNKLHEQLSLIRSHVDEINDPEARQLLNSMEFGMLAPMRRLRLRLDIPYDWHEQRSEKEGKPL
ncbi:MAG: hypothetical protein WCG29_11730 [Desulfomonile sp.]|jgi:hypothetical protein|nr:hypothetical protein [Deltaproteobacteria bacterium]